MKLSLNERVVDDEETMRLMLEGFQSSLQTCLPGIIQSFNPANSTVVVQPALKGSFRQQDDSLQSVSLPLLVDVPVLWQGGGGLTATFPIQAGDECIVIFASRCIDSWWQLGGVQVPLDTRMHSLSDAFALVGVRSSSRAINVSTSGAQLRNNGGTASIELTAAGAVNIIAPGGVHITGQVNATGDILAGLISLLHHIHGNVQTGGSTTGQPQ